MTWIINNWRSLTQVLIASFIAALAYKAGADKVQTRWNKEKLVSAQALIIANAKAMAIERKSQETLAQKQKELEDEKRNTEMAIANADAELSRLQNTLASLKRKLSTAAQPPSPSDAALTQSWTLLGECAKKYQQMGQVADQQRDQLAEWQAYGGTVDQFRDDVKKLENVK
jgi:chromosome segregation ATPase